MAAGDPFTLTGETKVTEAESREHQATLYAKRTMDVPSDIQARFDYDVRTDGQPVYIGYGPRGLAVGAAGWLLYKFTYDGSNQATLRQVAYDTWSNRTSATYA